MIDQHDAAASRVRFYRAVCGLPCSLADESGRILLRAEDIGAITLPAALGAQLHGQLIADGISGPVIAYDSGRWSLLTRPHRLGGDLVLAARLNAVNAHIVPSGANVLLPSPQDEAAGRLHWIVPPREMFRPAMETVLGALAHVIAGSHVPREVSARG
jgi:hypothetical protein